MTSFIRSESGTQAIQAFVSWPTAPLTDSLVRSALDELVPLPRVMSHLADRTGSGGLLQWSTYDVLDHDLTCTAPSQVLSSSYVIRKALIRKHYLSRCIQNYLSKHPSNTLRHAVPRTWDFELCFADDLEDLWVDELWDLGRELDEPSQGRWWILKPGMADRGMGIRLFHSKEELSRIFADFEGEELDDGVSSDDGHRDTSVVTSQLRHFVIQEYLLDPLLIDPSQVSLTAGVPSSTSGIPRGYKFHLRAYCVSAGALTVYLYQRVLALFSAIPYTHPKTPGSQDGTYFDNKDIAAHLTNTSLQAENGEAGVRLLDELVGCQILGSSIPESILSEEDVKDVKEQMSQILAETFKAALDMSVHFQPLPNAFELYGVDFLVTQIVTPSSSRRFQVHLLEINSEPAIELTGPRLTWILRDLFSSIAQACVAPFFKLTNLRPHNETRWLVGEERYHLKKSLEVEVRGVGGW